MVVTSGSATPVRCAAATGRTTPVRTPTKVASAVQATPPASDRAAAFRTPTKKAVLATPPSGASEVFSCISSPGQGTGHSPGSGTAGGLRKQLTFSSPAPDTVSASSARAAAIESLQFQLELNESHTDTLHEMCALHRHSQVLADAELWTPALDTIDTALVLLFDNGFDETELPHTLTRFLLIRAALQLQLDMFSAAENYGPSRPYLSIKLMST